MVEERHGFAGARRTSGGLGAMSGPPSETGRRRLVAALAAALVAADGAELRLVRAWLDGWGGLGRVVVGMARQDFDLELRGCAVHEAAWNALGGQFGPPSQSIPRRALR